MTPPTTTVVTDGPSTGAPEAVDQRQNPVCTDRHRRTILLALLVIPLWAYLCTAVLETPMWWGRRGHAFSLLAAASKPIDLLIVLIVLVWLWSLTGRLWLSAGILLVLTSALSAINVTKMSILAEPLYPSDYQFLTTPGFLVEMVRPSTLALAVAGLVLLTTAVALLGRRLGMKYPHVQRSAHPQGWWGLVGVRAVTLVVLTLALSSMLHFNEPGNPWRRMYEATGVIWQPFSQSMNYRSNGFIGGALYNLPTAPMPVPDGYSRAKMEEVAARYDVTPPSDTAGSGLDDVNVVLVLSEAFADLTRLRGVEVAVDPMPETRATIEASWGGDALANFYGTGTSSMEFEALTGQSLGLFNPQVTAPYQNFMSDLDSYPSAVGWFAAHGHDPIAVHPYRRDMYRRDQIYPMLGFTRFIDEDTIGDSSRLERNDYISDEGAFDEVETQIAASDDPLFVNLVTMQNHVPSGYAYEDPVHITAAGDREQVRGMAGYARGQLYSDAALADFLADLRSGPEPTVVVFYGDHYPASLPDEVLQDNPGIGQLLTPMFIWSSEGQTPRALPVTNPATFLPYVFELLGEPLPPYYRLLMDVATQVGAIGPGRIVTPEGREIRESDLTPEQQRLVDDYRLVQYDFSVGEHYVVDRMWYELESP